MTILVLSCRLILVRFWWQRACLELEPLVRVFVVADYSLKFVWILFLEERLI